MFRVKTQATASISGKFRTTTLSLETSRGSAKEPDSIFGLASFNQVDDSLSFGNENGFVMLGGSSSNTFVNSRAQGNPGYGVLDQGSNNDTSGIVRRLNGND